MIDWKPGVGRVSPEQAVEFGKAMTNGFGYFGIGPVYVLFELPKRWRKPNRRVPDAALAERDALRYEVDKGRELLRQADSRVGNVECRAAADDEFCDCRQCVVQAERDEAQLELARLQATIARVRTLDEYPAIREALDPTEGAP